jgi:hypothetical protein
MTTYIIFGSLFILLIITLGITLLRKLNEIQRKLKSFEKIEYAVSEKAEKAVKKKKQLDWKISLLLLLVLTLIIISFYSPFFFTKTAVSRDLNFSDTGEIGDTIGGLMNPFIALAGVIVTGLAFYVQYRANEQQRELFIEQIDHQNLQTKKQQFESQFYEMLKLHRENINEMKIEGYDFEETNTGLKRIAKTTDGRKIFVTMKTEFECILSLYAIDHELDQEGFKKCYKLFFSGLDEFEKKHPEEKNFTELLRKIRKTHEEPDIKIIKTNKDRKESSSYAKLYFNYKPFAGHASRLGHYFRHLYLTVKSTIKNPVLLKYKEKMRYLKLLRAQLSNHEQILLFYNWLGEHGDNWENNKHAFFTEYCMIHNLWYDNLFEADFISEKVNYLRTKKVEKRKSSMFEIDD